MRKGLWIAIIAFLLVMMWVGRNMSHIQALSFLNREGYTNIETIDRKLNVVDNCPFYNLRVKFMANKNGKAVLGHVCIGFINSVHEESVVDSLLYQ